MQSPRYGESSNAYVLVHNICGKLHRCVGGCMCMWCAHMQGNPSKARDLTFVLFELIILCVDLQQYENWLSWKEQGAQDTQFSLSHCSPGA